MEFIALFFLNLESYPPMPTEPIQLPWEHPNWFEEITAWIQVQLVTHGWPATGPVALVHQRPWSAFARVPTAKGMAHFKAPAPALKYEAALTQALMRWRPDCTVPLLAVEPTHGWLLAADAGETLRVASPNADQVAHWVKLLPYYAELQRQMVAHMPELLTLGLEDRRLAQLPQRYAELLEDTENLRIGLEQGLTPTEYQQLRDWQPRFAEACAQLASYGLPETLTHEEVHDANVLVNGDRYIFIDWGDSSLGHPFFTMLVTLRAAAHRLKLPETGPEIRRLRDAYLEPWTTFETRAKLETALDLAYRLGMVNRALSWQQSVGRLPAHLKEPYADSVPGWLQDYVVAEKQFEAEQSNPTHAG